MAGKWHLGVSAANLAGRPRRKRSTRHSHQERGDQAANHTFAFMPAMHGFDDSLVFPFSNQPTCDPYGNGSAASVAFCMLVGKLIAIPLGSSVCPLWLPMSTCCAYL
jgi:hypothetical protein